jgi:hypothetical protein
VGGDGGIRFVELYAPPSAFADNCVFSSTRLEVIAADGTVVGTVTPFTTTTCFGGDTYFLFATAEAAAHYGVPADAPLTYAPAPDGGQVCLRSSATRYDCARWGAVSVAVTDFGDPSDMSAAPAIPDGQALARVDTTDVVAADFAVQSATPRQPNDGTPWFPPDAGPTPLDAAVGDADVTADAQSFPDAPPVDLPDARTSPPDWLSADPGGSPSFSCAAWRGGPGGAAGSYVLRVGLFVGLLAAALPLRRVRARRSG